MRTIVSLAILLIVCASGTGCATIRTTDPPRTATEQFLLSGAAARAIEQLSSESLRDRKVFIDSTYLGSSQTANEYAFLIGEHLTNRLLKLIEHEAMPRQEIPLLILLRVVWVVRVGLATVPNRLGIGAIFRRERRDHFRFLFCGEIP